ncbi:HAD family hydrolase [Anabaena cylindrica FACHB-243]|uniref:REG-2-like, HAD superfamily (Subfamily IA) hydrolase n=1 Tax=Anabaena cylindrica (strain ATCC 27899 / PCC 7122) TaxID=272123 RepID=K9ZFX6_ANACC|nr:MULTISPECIES: HAD family hydrolase [Anabaena]AFZ57492.1 REG-2-like, HAD superfamily (subfamily IA) hydrolase [Anabaena cylindrica PCC 7122]MBD2421176.1 HAD family hydrolase [Anabaena cylindrica FACHB-243]MBY5281726.1 HAD family hydrolase [Anabaena sp. CCAP 1446/1C]MBY5310319.1 HAD family hydrolase [Anabaena sp. CCAP 1446/1C]MCM2405934.1 HAD family hydrolase [Anabaena sp. CCAP 1446/1C]
MKKPKVIFLDAVGTLFGVKGSVGIIYSQIAQDFGVVVSPETLNKQFFKSFKASPPPIFLDTDIKDIPQREFDWWRVIALNTFEGAGVLQEFTDFSAFFSELYIHFGTAEPWFVYPDVPLALVNWRRLGVELGVLSNFDSRLYSVLQSLGLKDYFQSITISTQVRTAKPDPQIFDIALQNHDCSPEEAWHIGDSIIDDYHGARSAGMRGIWINRQ